MQRKIGENEKINSTNFVFCILSRHKVGLPKNFGLVAQLVEQRPFKAKVPGSSPGKPTITQLHPSQSWGGFFMHRSFYQIRISKKILQKVRITYPIGYMIHNKIFTLYIDKKYSSGYFLFLLWVLEAIFGKWSIRFSDHTHVLCGTYVCRVWNSPHISREPDQYHEEVLSGIDQTHSQDMIQVPHGNFYAIFANGPTNTPA